MQKAGATANLSKVSQAGLFFELTTAAGNGEGALAGKRAGGVGRQKSALCQRRD